MRIEKRKAKNQPNLVSSFTVAFQKAANLTDSMCIKYAMFDGTTRLSYWESKWLVALHQCIEYYSGIHYYGSDLQKTVEDPFFYPDLPKRHPVRTMNDEKPTFTEDDFKKAKRKFSVTSLVVVDHGDICCIECMYPNGDRRIEMLPAYIAMNLCGSLKASFDLSDLMVAKPGGTA